MSLGEKSLANQPLLADDDEEEEEDEDDDLAGGTLTSHNLISHDELMVHGETVKNNVTGEQEYSQRLSQKLPYSLHMPVSSLDNTYVNVQRWRLMYTPKCSSFKKKSYLKQRTCILKCSIVLPFYAVFLCCPFLSCSFFLLSRIKLCSVLQKKASRYFSQVFV